MGGWAEHVLTSSLGLRPGETVLALTDEPLRQAGEALCAAAHALGSGDARLCLLPDGGRHLVAVPGPMLRLVAQADVIVSLVGTLDLGRETAPLRAAVAAFREAGRGRWAFGAYIDEAVLDALVGTDYGDVARVAGELADCLARASEVRLVTAAGTDLRLSMGGRPVHQDTGLLTAPGAFGNLPAGEAYVAPLEDSAEGRLVVDLCVGDLRVREPLTLRFERGRVVAMEGARAVQRELHHRLGDDPWAWTVGELGLGANRFARVRGRVTTDEKVLGTAHVALGANRQFGGKNPAATHYDCVIRAPRIWLDGVEWELPGRIQPTCTETRSD